MHFQVPQSAGPAPPPEFFQNDQQKPVRQFKQTSSSLPFGQHVAFSDVAGPTYVTPQTLIQQVAYALSDKLFTYSPDTFDLDVAAKRWSAEQTPNAHGYTTKVSAMQTRAGAGSIALGYMFSNDFDITKRHIPQTLIGSSSSLTYLRAALDQLSLLYSVANPFVAHIAAVDYAGASSNALVNDYAIAQSIADDLGLGLISGASPYESQHMALFATLMASITPTLHIYDGVAIGRETVRVIDVLDQGGLARNRKLILDEFDNRTKKRDSLESRVSNLLDAFNDELGTEYGFFEYVGSSEAEQVLVVFGTVEASLSSQIASELAKGDNKVGVVSVRIYRPFLEEEFLRVLPHTLQQLIVLGQVRDREAVADPTVFSNLYNDVLAAVFFSSKWSTAPSVIDAKYPRDRTWAPESMTKLFYTPILAKGRPRQLFAGDDTAPVEGAEIETPRILDPSAIQQYTFWNTDESPSTNSPQAIGKLLSTNSSVNVTLKATHDNLIQGGVKKSDIRSSKKTVEAAYSNREADVVFVLDSIIFKAADVLHGIRVEGTLVILLAGGQIEALEKILPEKVRKEIHSKNLTLFIVDPEASISVKNDADFQTYLIQLAFLKISQKDLSTNNLEKLAAINGSTETFEGINSDLESAVRQVSIPEAWRELEMQDDGHHLPSEISVNSFVSFDKEESQAPSLLRNWEAVAKGLVFKEAYGTRSAVRPDLSVKTWVVNVKENRRLTPKDYDRNIFHIEFDLGQSGLKYDIGEALGIHAENDLDEVNEFINFYGLNPEEVVEVPLREDPKFLDVRTVHQALMQNVDIFGRPPKRFYEALAEFASDPDEQKELLALGGPEGAVEFKRRAEVDTITYADILLEFPSAHPSFHDIVKIVNPMKRREYSIASSQKVTPTSVALLIVVIGWVDPKGRDRFGQATRYLNERKIGDRVTVSVKPSVMKLPPSSTQPLIMSGLGTGLAPFRAFVQYRAWEKAQGKDIGSVLLYMGARHQREEYLYGEEWEAYQDAGVITLLGRAFSRDQPQKIYIQDRMRQTIDDLIQAYIEDTGAFYLCGPTWPVPDVTEVLQEVIAKHAKATGKKVDPRKEIERLKDDSRYVLEGESQSSFPAEVERQANSSLHQSTDWTVFTLVHLFGVDSSHLIPSMHIKLASVVPSGDLAMWTIG
ncbi:MAG: hypothetical protein M1833_003742 [Piccolia ochrophora]|nr:MAG: hypothetical protein M1833_003742 [Piccolia ochrophora]